MKAVILAGGKGSRLRPYTLVLPKPLMPVDSLPVIEILLKWLRRHGIDTIYIAIGYLGRLIQTLCGDGSQWGLSITYSKETEPLGTIGPLRLVEKELDGTFLLVNGDLITDLDLRSFVRLHQGHGDLVTVAATERTVQMDFGVIEGNNGRITAFREKPSIKHLVSMGVYCMEPGILDFIPHGTPFGFDDLMHAMLAKDLPVHIYRHQGIWMDVGRSEDFMAAQEVFEKHESSLLGC